MPRFESFVIEIDPCGRETAALLRAADAIAGEELGAGWVARPLAPQAGEFEIDRDGGSRRLAPGRAWDLARKLRARRDVASAEPLFETAGLEPDPKALELLLLPHERLPVQKGGPSTALPGAAGDCLWSLKLSRFPEAWNLLPPVEGAQQGGGVRIAHPDTGYTKHPEIWSPANPRILPALGFNYVDGTPDATDPLTGSFGGHGTGTASVIMSDHIARSQPPFVSGAAPAAELVPMRVGNSVIHLSFSRLIRALNRAVDKACPVVSMSLGGPIPSAALERAVERATSSGTILLAAAGNIWPFVVYPARLDDVLAVAACNVDDKPWRGSARGSAVDFTAPGESVWRATASKGGYDVGMGSGTSFAVATAAGACALWLAFHGGPAALSARFGVGNLGRLFREMVVRTVRTPAGWDTDNYGAGILDAEALLRMPLPATVPALPKGLGGRAASRPGLIETATAYFPGVDPDRIVGVLLRHLAVDSKSVRRAFADVGDEVLFQLGTNPAYRALVAAEAIPSARRAKGGPRASLTAASFSKAFAARLGI